jgi:hypothetical protein
MALRLRLITIVALFCSWATVSTVLADPVVITSGTAVFNLSSSGMIGQGGPASIAGTDGFSFEGHISSSSKHPGTCAPCLPGASISLIGVSVGDDLSGLLTYNGTSFLTGSASSNFGSIGLTFAGSLSAPPLPLVPSTLTVMAPFTMTGAFLFPFVLGPFDSVPLAGSGIATVLLAWPAGPVMPEGWAVRSVQYSFADTAATPEPATATLLATSLSGLVFCLRRVRARHPAR